MTRHLALVGLMGAGKTTVGRCCATALGREFLDTDELVEATAGMTVAAIFAGAGEEQFREFERVAVADACASPTPLVIACGGGVVTDAANRAVLRERCVVVWLRASPEALGARIGGEAGRPLLASGSPVSTLERLARLREPTYEAAAHAVVDTEGRPVEAVTDAVIEEFRACDG